jgi:ribonuclease D
MSESPPPEPVPEPLTAPDEIEALARRVEAAGEVAIDTESNSMFVYRERICLVQLAFADEAVAVDPLAFDARAIEPLRSVLEDPEFPVYLHGGEYDVAVLKREWSMNLRGLFDTQQAASFLGWERTGYGSLVERVRSVKLDKAHARHDWGRRPIDPAALAYALDDVRHLRPLVEYLREELRQADLEQEVELANRAVEGVAAHHVSFDPAGFHRIKDARKLDEAQRLRLQVLFAWRDERARIEDRPPGRLLNQHVLISLARRPPRTKAELRRVRLPGAVARRHGESLLQALADAEAKPPESVPAPAKRRRPAAERKRVDRLKAWRREEAERRGVSLSVVLPAPSIEALAVDPSLDLEQVPQLGSKRIRLYAEQIRSCLG